MTHLTFNSFDSIMKDLNVCKDVSKLIFKFYFDVECRDCKISCKTCEFCNKHRNGNYFCVCCCNCSICWQENWESWFESHSGIKLEDD